MKISDKLFTLIFFFFSLSYALISSLFLMITNCLPKTYTTKLAPFLSYLSSSAPSGNSISTGISRSKRKLPTVDYLLKVETFSSLKENLQQYHISDVFEIGRHKWRLCLSLNGNKEDNGYISLYLSIVDTHAYPLNWEVHVTFKFLLFDKIHDQYLTIQGDLVVRRFHKEKMEWGFAQLISLEDFYNPSNGYLVDDYCEFGVEVYVLPNSIQHISINRSIVNGFHKDTFTWNVQRFSKRVNWNYIESQIFIIDELVWTLLVYPRGYDGGVYGQERQVSLGLNLYTHQEISLPTGKEVSLEYKMRLLNTNETKHLERVSFGRVKLSKRSSCCWEENIIWLKDLQEASRGFIKNDILTVEVHISSVEVHRSK